MGQGDDRAIRVSVIVPFFNAEWHIGDCAESLMGQTMKAGIEFIFVDDGSTDGGLAALSRVIERHPERRGQTTVLRNGSNRGAAFSRQRGIDAARGEYLIHCDADDRADSDMYATLLKAADGADADVACSAYFLETPGKTTVVRFRSPEFPPLNEMPLDTVHCSLCNKLIRRQLLLDHELRIFEGIDCWEDLGLMFRVVIFARRIAICDRPLYHYRKLSADSLTTESMSRVLADHLRLAEAMDRWFGSQPPGLAQRHMPFILFVRFTAKIKMLRGRGRDIRKWLSTYPETNRHILSYRNIPPFYRLCFFLAYKLPVGLVETAIRAARLLSR